jgi:hypothetical protein
MVGFARASILLTVASILAIWVRRISIWRAFLIFDAPAPSSPSAEAHSDSLSIRRPNWGEEFIAVFLLSRWRGNPCLSDAIRGQPPDDAPPRADYPQAIRSIAALCATNRWKTADCWRL